MFHEKMFVPLKEKVRNELHRHLICFLLLTNNCPVVGSCVLLEDIFLSISSFLYFQQKNLKVHFLLLLKHI